MDKKIFGFGITLILLSLSFMMFGCKKESIKFNRESQARNLLKEFAPVKQKDITKKTGGMIIIKEQKKNNSFHGNFGPVDINFDMPEAIK